MDRRILYVTIFALLLIGTSAKRRGPRNDKRKDQTTGMSGDATPNNARENRARTPNRQRTPKPKITINKNAASDGFVDVCFATDLQGALHIQKTSKNGFQMYFYHVLVMAQHILKSLDPKIHLRFKGAAPFGSVRHLGLINFVDKKLMPKIRRAIKRRYMRAKDGLKILGSANHGIFRFLWPKIQSKKKCDVIFWVAYDDWLMKLTRTDGVGNMYSICTDEAYSVVEYKPDFRAMVVLVTHEVAHMMGVYHDESRREPFSGKIVTRLHRIFNVIAADAQSTSEPRLNIKTVLSNMAISMLKIRRPLGRLIFNMRIAIPERRAEYTLDGIINEKRIMRTCKQAKKFGCKGSIECVMGLHPSWPRHLKRADFSYCSRAYFRLFVELTRTHFLDEKSGRTDLMYYKSCFMKETEPDRVHIVSYEELKNKN